jgi:hypothetical protein
MFIQGIIDILMGAVVNHPAQRAAGLFARLLEFKKVDMPFDSHGNFPLSRYCRFWSKGNAKMPDTEFA